MSKKIIAVQYDNDESAMYGSNGSEGYDALASEKAYEEMLTSALQEEYPDDEIEVEVGYGSISVDGDKSDDEVPWIEQVVHKTWSGFGWLRE